MRTTLEIDDDVLDVAKVLARQSDRTVGAVLSDLARRALTNSPPAESVRFSMSMLRGLIPPN